VVGHDGQRNWHADDASSRIVLVITGWSFVPVAEIEPALNALVLVAPSDDVSRIPATAAAMQKL